MLVLVIGATAFLEFSGRSESRSIPTSTTETNRSADKDYARYRSAGWIVEENL